MTKSRPAYNHKPVVMVGDTKGEDGYSPLNYFSEEAVHEALRALEWSQQQAMSILIGIAKDDTLPPMERRFALRDLDARIKESLILSGKLRSLDQKLTYQLPDGNGEVVGTSRTIQLLRDSTHRTLAALRVGSVADLPNPPIEQEIVDGRGNQADEKDSNGCGVDVAGDQSEHGGPVRNRDSSDSAHRPDRGTDEAVAGVEEGQAEAKTKAGPKVRAARAGNGVSFGPKTHRPPIRGGGTSGICRNKPDGG